MHRNEGVLVSSLLLSFGESYCSRLLRFEYKGKLIGQKSPLKRKDIWTLRVKLELTPKHERGLAMFNLAIDSKLRASDLVKLKVKDISVGERILKRAMIIQQKTALPVQFEITKLTRDASILGL